MNRDVKIGLVLVVLVGVGLAVSTVQGRKRGVRFAVDFDDGGNLKAGDIVYMLGVDVGEVLDIELLPTRKVRVHAKLGERFCSLVPADSKLLIVNDKFIFGKKALLVVPSTGQKPPIAEGMVLRGIEGYTDLYLGRGSRKLGALWTRLKDWLGPVDPDPAENASPLPAPAPSAGDESRSRTDL